MRLLEVNEGQPEVSYLTSNWLDIFYCNTAVFSFDLICNTPIFLVIVILTILEVKRSKKVIRGQIMVMRGHMVNSRKKMLSLMISLGVKLFFDIHHAYVPKC